MFPLNTVVGLGSKLTIVKLNNIETLMFMGNFRPSNIEHTRVRVAVINSEEILTRIPLTILHEDFTTEIGDIVLLDDCEIITEAVPQLEVIKGE